MRPLKLRNTSTPWYADYSLSRPRDYSYLQREKAWSIRPWPCTGLGVFLSSALPKLFIYPSLVSSLKAGSKILDIGCYCGTDLRRLLIDGCPQESLYGTDFVNHWEIGFELYRDKATFGIEYVEADILNPNAGLLALSGSFDFVSAVQLLHNWDWATQVRACMSICALTRPGSKVIGNQGGTSSADASTWISPKPKEGIALHSVKSFARMWDEVGRLTNTEWTPETHVEEWEVFGYKRSETQYLGKETGMLQFVVTRVR